MSLKPIDTLAEHLIDHAALGLDNHYVGFTVDIQENILDSSPARVRIAYATDVERFYIWDGSGWYESAVQFTLNTDDPDMGVPADYSRQGYGTDYISDKALSFCTIGAGADDEEGAFRCTVSGTFQVYLNGVWNDVVINFVFREDSDGSYELEHMPIGFGWWYEIMSGNSDELGIDGRPIIQQYGASMGAYQHDLEISGGTF